MVTVSFKYTNYLLLLTFLLNVVRVELLISVPIQSERDHFYTFHTVKRTHIGALLLDEYSQGGHIFIPHLIVRVSIYL